MTKLLKKIENKINNEEEDYSMGILKILCQSLQFTTNQLHMNKYLKNTNSNIHILQKTIIGIHSQIKKKNITESKYNSLLMERVELICNYKKMFQPKQVDLIKQLSISNEDENQNLEIFEEDFLIVDKNRKDLEQKVILILTSNDQDSFSPIKIQELELYLLQIGVLDASKLIDIKIVKHFASIRDIIYSTDLISNENESDHLRNLFSNNNILSLPIVELNRDLKQFYEYIITQLEEVTVDFSDGKNEDIKPIFPI